MFDGCSTNQDNLA